MSLLESSHLIQNDSTMQNTSTIQNTSAEDYIKTLNQEALNHRAVNHPFLIALENGEFPFPAEAIKDFTYQYLAYSQDFLRFLTVTISKLENRNHRNLLMENLMEESGQIPEDEVEILAQAGIQLDWIDGIPHPALYTRFLDAIGYDLNYRQSISFCDESRIWSKLFLKACNSGSAAQSLGAIGLGTENIVKHVYKPVLNAIKNFLEVSNKDRVFFDLHALLDDEHGEILNTIAAEFANEPSQRPAIRDGMLMALDLRACFYDGMLNRTCLRQKQLSHTSKLAS